MTQDRVDRLFERFRQSGDARALARVFDRCAPELYRVAAYLSPDSGSAEDLVQACFVEVIENRDRFRAGERIMPWMLGILGNLARRKRRARRPVDNSRLSRSEIPGPLQAAEEAEFREEFRSALDRLPDTYREVLALHLLHGLRAGEIAEALNRPAGTVRTQLVRGMEQLRRALPASLAGGMAIMSVPAQGLAAIRARVLETAGVPAELASSFAIGLFGTMFTMKKSIATVLALILLLGLPLVVSFWDEGPVSPNGRQDAVEPAAVALGSQKASEEKAISRRSVGGTVSKETIRGIRIHATYAGDDAPAAGVRIYLVDGPANRWQVLESALTDAQGSVQLSANPGIVYLRTDRGTRVSEATRAEAPGETRLSIPVGMDLRGRCIDEFGEPIAGASVHAQVSDFPEPEGRVLAQTGEDGSFCIREVESDMAKIWATAPGRRRSQQLVLWGGSGSEHRVDLRLTAGASALSGQVFDRLGKPAPGAMIYLAWQSGGDSADMPQELVIHADATGLYSVPDLWPGPISIFARDAGDGRALARFDLVEGQSHDLDLHMLRGATLRGVITDQHGKTWGKENVIANWYGSEIASRHSSFADHMGLSDEDGRFNMEGLLPGKYRLSAGWAGDRRVESVELEDGQAYEWNPIIPRGIDQPIRLLDADGKALVGWRVALLTDLETGRSGSQERMRPAGQAYTDEGGLAVLYNLQVESGELIATEPAEEPLSTFGQMGSLPTARLGESLVTGEEQVLKVDASSRPRSVLQGRLTTAEGESLPGIEMVLRWENYFSSLRMRSREDGGFRFTRLSPGSYVLMAMRNSQANFETVSKFELDGSEHLELGDLPLPELCTAASIWNWATCLCRSCVQFDSI
ncbi:MAG: sigma-70 family RNA polymerase sigma factor [Planctomycetota bacterium]|jgi:RNA polymerase sigma-70 factor (ECF subfamily)